MYNIIFLHLYTQTKLLPTKSLFSIHYHVDSLYHFTLLLTLPLSLSGDHYSILCICVLSFSLVGSFILVLFVCYIPHVSEIVWYLSFSIWLIWKRLFKCHLRRQSEKTAKCLPIAYPSKVSWWHVPELICMDQEDSRVIPAHFYTMYSSLPLWVREEMRESVMG